MNVLIEKLFRENRNISNKEDFLIDKIITHLTKTFKVNGPQYRGAEMPSAIDSCVNEISIDDNLRAKSYDIDIEYIDEVFQTNISWITQEEFTNAETLIDEIVRWFEYQLHKIETDYSVHPIFNLTIEIESRDGKSYGYEYYNDSFNI
jgi:hypothetical protein